MAHIHIPDGVLNISWLIFWYIITFLFLLYSFHKLKDYPKKAKILVGVFSALMLVFMSLPLGPYHLNLSCLSGLIISPPLTTISVFMVNLILASVGHGGITVVGANTFLIGVLEPYLAYYLYKAFGKMKIPLKYSVFFAVFITLTLSTFAMIGIIYSGVSGGFTGEILTHEHENVPNQGQREPITLEGATITLFPISIVGALLEALITSATIIYLSKIRPDILIGLK